MDPSAARILGVLYIALVTASFTDEQRKVANDMVLRAADRSSTPPRDAETLRLIARSATIKRPSDDDAPAPTPKPVLRLVVA